MDEWVYSLGLARIWSINTRQSHKPINQMTRKRNQPANLKGIIKGITKGFFKGIILVSLRVIDGGFCRGNEFLTLRRGLRHIRHIFLSDRLLELGIGYWASGWVSASFPSLPP